MGGSHRLVTQCPAHDSRVGRLGKTPLALPNEAPHCAGQLKTIEVTNRTGFKHRNHRKRALDAAVHALRITVVKMRAHDAKRQVLLDARIELGASKPLAQRLLPGTSRALRRNVPTDAPEIENPAGCRMLAGNANRGKDSSWSGTTSRMNETSLGIRRRLARAVCHDPQGVEVHTLPTR